MAWKYFQRIIIVIFCIFCFCTCQDSNQISDTKDYKIVFLSNRDAPKRQFDIFQMNPDGSAKKNLTEKLEDVVTSSKPILSPDGKKILYLAYAKDTRLLKLLDVDGSNPLELVEIKHDNPQALFTPDGKKIIYVSNVAGHRQIHKIDLDGSNDINLTKNKYDAFEPCLSPDGSRIAFVTQRGKKTQSIWLMDINGVLLKRLTDHGGDENVPKYSPDGKNLAFQSTRDGNKDVYIMEIDNPSRWRNLSNNDAQNLNPMFSPDGNKIAYSTNRTRMTIRDVMIIDLESDEKIILTKTLPFYNQHSFFKPDGKDIVFECGDGNIYSVDINGDNIKKLTDHPKWDSSPAF